MSQAPSTPLNPSARRTLALLFIVLLISLLSACGQTSNPQPTGPANPVSFTATPISTSSVTLAWSAVDGATGYTLERKTSAGSYSQIATPGAEATTYSDNGLSENTTYTYRVKSVNSQGSSPGKEITTTTLSSGQTNQGVIRGTLYAPAGGDVQNTYVGACFVVNNQCDETKSSEINITTSGSNAAFELADLQESSYVLYAVKDANANGTYGDNGDYYAEYASPVTPPAQNVELRLAVMDEGTEPEPLDPEPFTVTGRVVDTQGNPIEGAKVALEPAMHEGQLITHTDSNGIYEFVDVPNAPYYVNAWHKTMYNGQEYCLRLGMPNLSDYDVFNPKDGIVRNFQWQLTGKIANYDEDWFFGGWVVLDVYGNMKDGTIEVTFTPTGQLIDGSTGSIVTRTFDPSQVDELYDVPAGPYAVTATLIELNGTRTPLGLKNAETYYDEPAEQIALAFDPAGNCNYSNGLTYSSLFIYSPYDSE